MRGRIHTLVGALFAALLAAGCASMDGLRPNARLGDPGALQVQHALAGAKLSGAGRPAVEWWKQLGDSQLDGLIDEALAGSPTLRIARARIDKAAAYAGIANAVRYPQADGSVDITRQRFSEHYIYPPPLAGSWNTQDRLELSLGWNLDFWGRNRAAYDSTLGQVKAAEVDAFATRLLLAAGIAHAYVQLQRAHEQLDIAQATLRQRNQLYELTQRRVEAGLDSRVDLKQAEAALPAAQEQIAQINEAIDLTRNQLAALLGAGPDRGLAIARPRTRSLKQAALPSLLPADLVGRRPDVVAQRWRVEAALKDIDAAQAEFYPNVNLTAFIGVQSLGLSKLLEAGSTVAGLGPAVRLPLFDAGRLRANLAGKNADFDLAVEQYNQTLVDALREVVDQVSSLRAVNAQRVELDRGLATAREAYDLALERYRAGIADYLQVLSAESRVLAQKSLHADLRARELDLSINLMRALGGGFEDAPAATARAY